MDSDARQLHAIVKGRVQGVGFRATVQHHAQKLELVGSVKNLPDGTVELYAQGSEEKLLSLLKLIREDCGLADVRDISADYGSTYRQFHEFNISF